MSSHDIWCRDSCIFGRLHDSASRETCFHEDHGVVAFKRLLAGRLRLCFKQLNSLQNSFV